MSTDQEHYAYIAWAIEFPEEGLIYKLINFLCVWPWGEGGGGGLKIFLGGGYIALYIYLSDSFQLLCTCIVSDTLLISSRCNVSSVHNTFIEHSNQNSKTSHVIEPGNYKTTKTHFTSFSWQTDAARYYVQVHACGYV